MPTSMLQTVLYLMHYLQTMYAKTADIHNGSCKCSIQKNKKQVQVPYMHLYVYACHRFTDTLSELQGAAGGGWEETGFNQEIHLQGFHLNRTGRCSTLLHTVN
ncbi:hypothetical protein ILYODFUR_019218 [Ilyodon furcidens]|uniref:Secreted protein n=1 Tax=Ilyodon furcidens TaxID=33524 RepID=A0ABV0U6M9_9TELE